MSLRPVTLLLALCLALAGPAGASGRGGGEGRATGGAGGESRDEVPAGGSARRAGFWGQQGRMKARYFLSRPFPAGGRRHRRATEENALGRGTPRAAEGAAEAVVAPRRSRPRQ